MRFNWDAFFARFAMRSLESMLRERIAERVARGKIDCRLSFVEAGTPATELNESMLAQLKTLSEKAQKAFPEADGSSLVTIPVPFGERLPTHPVRLDGDRVLVRIRSKPAGEADPPPRIPEATS